MPRSGEDAWPAFNLSQCTALNGESAFVAASLVCGLDRITISCWRGRRQENKWPAAFVPSCKASRPAKMLGGGTPALRLGLVRHQIQQGPLEVREINRLRQMGAEARFARAAQIFIHSIPAQGDPPQAVALA